MEADEAPVPEVGDKEEPESTQVDVAVEGDEENVKIVLNGPGETSKEEREEHLSRNHAEYQPWCKFCIGGRGKERPHKTIMYEDRGTTVQLDCFFMNKTKNGKS